LRRRRWLCNVGKIEYAFELPPAGDRVDHWRRAWNR
jgi:hypothetical protein